MDSFQSATKQIRGKYIIIGIILVVIAVVFAVSFVLRRPTEPNKETTGEATTEKFYSALGNAAMQQKIRVGMYRETFTTNIDAEKRQNVGTVASSVSEIDTDKGYRSVFAHNTLQPDGAFSVGRCIDKTTYSEVYHPPARHTTRATTLKEAAARMQLIPEGNLFEVTQPLVFISCPHLGLLPANPPLAVARLSDGVFPVTLSEKQAENWQKELQEAKLFTVKDEGMVERDGMSLRKISFYPAGDELSINQKLYDIFYEAGEIAKIKSEQPNAEVDYEFQSINPINTGGIRGFYLIDEHKNLPVYSELAGLNQDKQSQTSAAKRNIARTKQTYSYSSILTISLTTPLEFLE